MLTKKVSVILKRFPGIYRLCRFFYTKAQPLFYIKLLLCDSRQLKNNLVWYEQIKKTQLRKKHSLFLDRQKEIKDFFNVNNFYLLKYFLKYGFPNTQNYKKKLMMFFNEKLGKDADLKKAYEDASFHYALRLMLAYERYGMVAPYLEYIVGKLKMPMEKINVLDYGCGVSDIGLLFASLGAKVTIADLDDKKFTFTAWRFKKRNLAPEIIKIKDPKVYPKLPKSKYDLIIATEIFEHVRNPLTLLQLFTRSLKSGGFLFDSMGGTFEREIVGDHLEEAIKIGQSKKYKEYYKKHYNHIFPGENLTYLFKKVK